MFRTAQSPAQVTFRRVTVFYLITNIGVLLTLWKVTLPWSSYALLMWSGFCLRGVIQQRSRFKWLRDF